MFKESVIENKRKKNFEKKQRLNAIHLRNKFLGEWASTVLGLDNTYKKKYIDKIASSRFKKYKNNLVIKTIEKDFADRNIKISFKEIELKIKDFQIKANIVIENQLKLNHLK